MSRRDEFLGASLPVNYEHVMNGDGGHSLFARLGDGRQIGELHLDSDETVQYVGVDKEHQRKGVASGLWNFARVRGLDPVHDPSYKTRAGAAWAKAVGD